MVDGSSKKLSSIIKKNEIEEKDAIKEKNRIDEIVEHRRTVLDANQRRCRGIENEIEELMKERADAMRRRDTAALVSLNSGHKSLLKKLSALKEVLLENERELTIALEHYSLANEDFVAARIEKKKVETLLSRREEEQRVKDAAWEEMLTDELGGKKRK